MFSQDVTKSLLVCGVFAGPIYIVVGIMQMIFREGFDIRRHAISLLSNGEFRWIQIANFVITGALVIACAVGMRSAMGTGPVRLWGPLLVGLYGAGVLLAGIFVADPALGFPVGTPEGGPQKISTHGLLHFVSGAVGFLSLIAGCFVLATRFATTGEWNWAAYSVATGVVFLAGFIGVASGTRQAWVNIAFSITVVLAWAWVSAIALYFIRTLR